MQRRSQFRLQREGSKGSGLHSEKAEHSYDEHNVQDHGERGSDVAHEGRIKSLPIKRLRCNRQGYFDQPPTNYK